MPNYYLKYLKYKMKYEDILKQQGGRDNGNNFDFYFVHSTTTIKNMLTILKTGVLKIVKDVSKRHIGLGGNEMKYVYANIFFQIFKI